MITFDYLLEQVRLYKKSILIANIIAIFLIVISVPIPLFIPFLVDEVLLGKEGGFVETVNLFIDVSSPEYYILLLTLIGISIVLLYLNWQLALIILVLNPIVIKAFIATFKKVSKMMKKRNKAISRFTNSLTECLFSFYG